MLQSDINRKAGSFDERARLERLQPPEMIQKTKAVRHPFTSIKARIVQTLQRADPAASPPVTAVNWYEVELMNAAIEEWSDAGGLTFQKGNIYKQQNKLYECKITHTNPPALPPDTTSSHWKEATSMKAWVFGYSGDLLEAVPWFQPGDIVEIIKYIDDRWPERQWWILETAIRIKDGDSCSLKWNSDEHRLMAVFG